MAALPESAAVSARLTLSLENTISERCTNLLSRGRWPKTLSRNTQTSIWAPHGCMLYPYKPKDAYECLSQRYLTFLGDSTARELFWATSKKLDEKTSLDLHLSSGKHQNNNFRFKRAGINFIWDPFLNTSDVPGQQLFSTPPQHYRNNSQVLVVGAGLWHIKHLGTSPECETSDLLPNYLEAHSAPLSTIILPISKSQKSRVTTNPSQLLEQNRTNRWNKCGGQASVSKNTTIQSTRFQSYLDIVDGAAAAFKADGIHISENITQVIADVLLNSICNDLDHLQGKHHTTYCCVPNRGLNSIQKLFLLSTLVFVCCSILKHFTHHQQKHRWSCGITLSDARRPHTSQSLAGILTVLLYCFIADRTFVFEKASKLVDLTSFIVVSSLMLMFGLASVSRVPVSSDVNEMTDSHFSRSQLLSRPQTEEWKGWMQIVILLYHYFGMSKVLWAYQLVRVLVASYHFMTGYGHTMYFLRTGDFSCRRVTTVLFRTNILSILLAFVMGTQFDLYYFPMLSSLWFLIIYATIVPLSKSAHTIRELILRTVLSAFTTRFLSWPLASTTSIMEVFLQSPGIFGIGLIKIDTAEFMFRFRLDMYIVFVGILAAIYCSRTSLADNSTIATHSRLSTEVFRRVRRLVVPGSICLIVAYVLVCRICGDKYNYNQWHPIVSPFAVAAFVVLRNSTKTIAGVYSRWFAWFGRCSLETFVLQYHIWLAADSRGLLRLSGVEHLLGVVGPKTRSWIEISQFMFLSALFLWASAVVSSALPVLTAMVLDRPAIQISETGHQIDSKISGHPSPGSNKWLLSVRMKAVIFALLLWGLNLCWLYLD